MATFTLRHQRSRNSETISALKSVEAAEAGAAASQEPLPFDPEAAMGLMGATPPQKPPHLSRPIARQVALIRAGLAIEARADGVATVASSRRLGLGGGGES